MSDNLVMALIIILVLSIIYFSVLYLKIAKINMRKDIESEIKEWSRW